MTRQERCLVSEVSHAGLLQARNALTGGPPFTPWLPSSPRFLLHRGRETRHRHLSDVRDDDESASKGAFVARLGTFNGFGSEDDVETVLRTQVQKRLEHQ